MYLCSTPIRNKMNVRKLILLIFFGLCFPAAALQAQLVFEPDTWDFGTIEESDGRVSHTFTGVNRGDKPLVILDIVTTCGCTVPAFSREPILPGGRTQVTVTFDPFNRPGAFAKELGVYSTERVKVAKLTVQGRVTPRPKSIEELYPVDAGGGLRLSQTLSAFSYVRPGSRVQAAVGYANTSDRMVRLDLPARESSGLLSLDYPRTIAPGERGDIGLAYFIPAAEPRYGTLRDVAEVRVDGRSNGTLLMAHGIGVDARPEPGTKSPVSELSENILKFGTVKHAGPVLRRTFTLYNRGEGELIVRAAEHDERIATSLVPGKRVPPGGSAAVDVTLNPAKAGYGILGTHLVLITNDPVRPMRRIRVTAIVEE